MTAVVLFMAVSIEVVVLFTNYMFQKKKYSEEKKKHKAYTHFIGFIDLI